MIDPTRDEMLATIRPVFDAADDIDMEEAMYWFASHYHEGQGSNLYSVLSTSDFKPGMAQRTIDRDTVAGDIYALLEDYFGVK